MVKPKQNKLLVVMAAIVVLMLTLSLISAFTGYGIKDWFKGKGKCRSNGYECGNCIDDDGDELIDYKVNKKGKVTGDPDCTSLTDNTESSCTPTCNSNSDCGTNGYVGSPYCGADGNAYRDYMIYTCYNPGECIASCDSQTNSYIWQFCNTNSTTCVNGACV